MPSSTVSSVEVAVASPSSTRTPAPLAYVDPEKTEALTYSLPLFIALGSIETAPAVDFAADSYVSPSYPVYPMNLLVGKYKNSQVLLC